MRRPKAKVGDAAARRAGSHDRENLSFDCSKMAFRPPPRRHPLRALTMQRFDCVSVVIGFALCLSSAPAPRPCAADVRLPHIFGSHMVLQRNLPVRIWGTAEAGEKVTVSIGDKEASHT